MADINKTNLSYNTAAALVQNDGAAANTLDFSDRDEQTAIMIDNQDLTHDAKVTIAAGDMYQGVQGDLEITASSGQTLMINIDSARFKDLSGKVNIAIEEGDQAGLTVSDVKLSQIKLP